MLAILLSQLLIVVSHDAVSRGQLRSLEKYADRIELAISLDGGSASSQAGKGNAIADSTIEAIMRWPALVAVELILPLKSREALALRRLKHLAVRLPPSPKLENGPPLLPLKRALKENPSLALLGPAMVRVERAPSTALAPGPCPGTEERVLRNSGSEIRIEGEVSRCIVDWLHNKLDPHSEPIGETPIVK